MHVIRGVIAITVLAAAAAIAVAQPLAYPPGLIARAKAMAAQCIAAGGRPGGNRTFMYTNFDFTGDGRKDFLLDEAAFDCAGKPNLFKTPAGAAVEIFVSQMKGPATSGYRGYALKYRVANLYPNRLYVTQSGAACGPGVRANVTCERPIRYSSATKRLAAGPPVMSGGAQGAPAPTMTAASSAPPPMKASQLSAAERAAIFKAAGFKLARGKYTRCPDDPSMSHTDAAIEMEDLNKDGRAEAWVTEGSVYCWGNTGESFVLVQKTASGAWSPLLDEVGVPLTKPSKHNGWPDIEVGGPGMGPFPVFRFNGVRYVR